MDREFVRRTSRPSQIDGDRVDSSVFRCRDVDLPTGLSLHLVTADLRADRFEKYWMSGWLPKDLPGLVVIAEQVFKSVALPPPVHAPMDGKFGALHYALGCPADQQAVDLAMHARPVRPFARKGYERHQASR